VRLARTAPACAAPARAGTGDYLLSLFTESLSVPDLDVALDWAARCPGSRAGGSVVVRPVAEVPGA